MTAHHNNTHQLNSISQGPHQLFEDQAQRTPDAPALLFGSHQLSYRELNSRANRLAHFLRSQGASPERLVAVCFDRSFDSVISLLAILKSGAAYLPLDPKFPKNRLSFMLADSEPPLLLSHSSMKETLPITSGSVIFLDHEEVALSKCSSANLSVHNSPADLAYLIYTSGSTGTPKGVMIPRNALVNLLLSMAQIPGIRSTDTLLAVTTTSFDISILELLLPLVSGARSVIATSGQAADAKELFRLIQKHDVTVMQATPATWHLLLESGWEGKSDLRILCGGEALTSELAAELLPRCQELWNMYGPTETTIWSSTERIISADKIFLGPPIANTQFYVLDDQQQPVAPGDCGELLIGGDGLARGYLKRPELTAEKFIANPNGGDASSRLYRTGDLVRCHPGGTLEFLGRLDQQVKLRGFRIELGEIESVLAKIPGISRAAVILREDRPGDKHLVAYYTGRDDLNSTSLRQALRTTLPDYMIPSAFQRLEQFPLTPNAKLDRKALAQPTIKRPLLAQEFIAPRTSTEKQLAALWCELLQLEEVGIDDSFFELGGHSLDAVRMTSLYHSRFSQEISPVKVFQYPTIAKLSRLLDAKETESNLLDEVAGRARHQRKSQNADDPSASAVAVIGMVGRFPGAANLDQLWQNLCNSVESITSFMPEELGPGIDENLRNDPDYIRARGLIDGADLFDPAFFGISPLEAKVTDPQQRVFLELAQHALENAGYDPERAKERIGVFAGIGDNHYLTTNLLGHPDLLAMAGKLAVEYGNQKDYVALRTAYLLDLRGPAVSLNTACSTTLLAIDQAYRSLLDYECDIALSGGIDITVPQKSGFLYQEGGTFAKDGHCRPFDADASGTMFCDGAGVVVLKRLADALTDGDTIYAVLRGTGKNNNGARSASFLAPSVDGQAEAIAMAQANADVLPETIGYIEAHGTGTPVGDPIEIEALRKVFESKTDKKHFCYVGSIKGNIGHPTNAAGVAGFIKAALVLHNEKIPPTLHFKNLNPKIDLAASPFLIADKLVPFPRGAEVRRTAVSSFGFGGTNVHAILEEAPEPKQGSASRPLQLLPLSAKTLTALDAYSYAVVDHLATSASESFSDAAYTLQTGRKQMSHRRFVVAADPSEAARLFLEPNPLRCSSKQCQRRNPAVVFLFGGQGTQYVNMGLNLYRDEPLFRAVVDDCCESLKPDLGRDLRELLYPQPGDEKTAQISLQDTFFTQPSIFVIEYALARFWQSLGIEPAVMVGHSIGEFVAATLAGVWEPQDALRIIALRGRLMQDLPRGSMLAVNTGADSLAKILPATVQIASNNAPNLCVVSGPEADVALFQQQLESENIVCRHLHTSHAFHSAMMDPMVKPLREAVAQIQLRPPTKPFISTVTGQPITAAETTDPGYWARHARATVEFSKTIRYLKEQGHDLFLECGPRSTLCSLARQQFTPSHPCTAIPTFADTHENNAEWATVLFALGSLWQNGLSIDWEAFYSNEDRRRIPLPTYPFARQRFWVDPVAVAPVAPASQAVSSSAVASPAEPLLVADSQEAPTSAGSPDSRKDRIALRLIELLAPVSGLEPSQISSSATFMDQGLDSLSLTQLAFAIRKEFSIKVSFSQLMNQLPNVDMLAAHLHTSLPLDIVGTTPPSPLPLPPVSSPVSEILSVGSTSETSDPARSAAIAPDIPQNETEHVTLESEDPYVLVPPPPTSLVVESTVPQRGMYASSRLSDHLSAAYNESMTLRFTGEISLEKMTRAMERLVERHDALRASFDEAGLFMKILSSLKIAMPVTDLSSIREATEQEQRLRALITQESSAPFLLPSGPLFRGHLVLLGTGRAALIFTAHHLICDGWSLDVMIHDLCAFYSQEISGTPSSLGQADSYASYVQTVTQRSHSSEYKKAANFWHAKFKDGFPVLVLPTDHPRTAHRDFLARRFEHPVPVEVVKNLRAFRAKHGCSFFAVLLSSTAILLARVSGQRRFVMALPTAEQPLIGQPGLVGHCVNLLPFVVELRDGECVSAFVRRIQIELLASMDQSIFTMISLLEELRPRVPALGISPISAGLTNVRKFKPSELPQSGFAVEYDLNPKSFGSFEFYLNAVEIEENFELRCHYDLKLFEDVTIREWLATLGSIFRDLASDPSREVLDLAGLKPRAVDSPATEVFYTQTSPPKALDAPSAVSNSEPLPNSSSSLSDSLMEEPALLHAMLPLWQRVLDVPEVSPDDDFFALGGHSILAAQLFALIERELGCSVPLATLYDAATPRALASVLSLGTKVEDWQSLVAINRSGDRPPLFLVHSAEGDVLPYRDLAAHLGPDQPVFGLQSAGLDGRSPIDAQFEHVAQRYVDEIRQVQPLGPYMLGGYGLGGTLALEMAQQLTASGETVGLLAMIESYNIRSIRWPLPLHQRILNHFVLNPFFQLQDFFVAATTDKGVVTRRRLPAIPNALPAAEIAKIYKQALAQYDVKPYSGELVLFLTDRHPAGFPDHLGGWAEVAQSGVRTFGVLSNPGGSLEGPAAQQVAHLLRGCLDLAIQRSQVPVHESNSNLVTTL